MSDCNIILNRSISRESIDLAVATSVSYNLDIENKYAVSSLETATIDIASLTLDERESFKQVFDIITYQFEQDALVFKVNKTGKTFSIADSYIRDVVSTVKPQTEIEDGTPMILRFEVSGFTENKSFELSSWYGEDFLSTELTDLEAELGIIITGNGTEFTIDNALETKLSFIKPSSVTLNYIIDNPYINEIIPI